MREGEIYGAMEINLVLHPLAAQCAVALLGLGQSSGYFAGFDFGFIAEADDLYDAASIPSCD